MSGQASPTYIGKYRVYGRDWSVTPHFSETPTHPGQQAIRFPLDWSPLKCAVVHSMAAQNG